MSYSSHVFLIVNFDSSFIAFFLVWVLFCIPTCLYDIIIWGSFVFFFFLFSPPTVLAIAKPIFVKQLSEWRL